MPERRWRTPADPCPVMVSRQLVLFAMRSSAGSNWPVHSMMLSFHALHALPLRRPPYVVLVFISVSCRHIRQNHDSLRCLDEDNEVKNETGSQVFNMAAVGRLKPFVFQTFAVSRVIYHCLNVLR